MGRDKTINWDAVDVETWDAYLASMGHDDDDVVLWDEDEMWPDEVAQFDTVIVGESV